MKAKQEKTDENTTISQLAQKVVEFTRERNWEQFHNPKNLVASISIEAAELLELFQWLNPEEANKLAENPEKKEMIADEISDILAYLLSLAHYTKIDVASSFLRKIKKNGEKYPADKFRGKAN